VDAGPGNLEELLNSGETWVIGPDGDPQPATSAG